MIAQRLVATVCKFSLTILSKKICQQVLTNDFCWKNNENVLFQEKSMEGLFCEWIAVINISNKKILIQEDIKFY